MLQPFKHDFQANMGRFHQCLRIAFTDTNALALKFYLFNIFVLNFIHYFQPKVCPNFYTLLSRPGNNPSNGFTFFDRF